MIEVDECSGRIGLYTDGRQDASLRGVNAWPGRKRYKPSGCNNRVTWLDVASQD